MALVFFFLGKNGELFLACPSSAKVEGRVVIKGFVDCFRRILKSRSRQTLHSKNQTRLKRTENVQNKTVSGVNLELSNVSNILQTPNQINSVVECC